VTFTLVATAADGCAFERRALEEAFQSHVAAAATVRESACRARGQAACEFEVSH